jgi:hypothetical protein
MLEKWKTFLKRGIEVLEKHENDTLQKGAFCIKNEK